VAVLGLGRFAYSLLLPAITPSCCRPLLPPAAGHYSLLLPAMRMDLHWSFAQAGAMKYGRVPHRASRIPSWRP